MALETTTVAMADADVTLTALQARSGAVRCTGTNTTVRDLEEA